jgi:hypothetical protein
VAAAGNRQTREAEILCTMLAAALPALDTAA